MNDTTTLLEVVIDSSMFLGIKETLERIGIANRDEKRLYQSCHILHKRHKYYIVHFKELYALDGKHDGPVDQADIDRRTAIAQLLQSWGLVKIVDKELSTKNVITNFKVLKHSEKSQWTLIPKYKIGKN